MLVFGMSVPANSILPMAGTWRPWLLSSASEFRPGPLRLAEKAAELAELKTFSRTPQTNN